jgi:hypothetical protein
MIAMAVTILVVVAVVERVAVVVHLLVATLVSAFPRTGCVVVSVLALQSRLPRVRVLAVFVVVSSVSEVVAAWGAVSFW